MRTWGLRQHILGQEHKLVLVRMLEEGVHSWGLLHQDGQGQLRKGRKKVLTEIRNIEEHVQSFFSVSILRLFIQIFNTRKQFTLNMAILNTNTILLRYEIFLSR